MKLTNLLAAAALFAAAAATTASAQVTGKVMLDGEAPEPKQLDMGTDPKCAAAHPNPVMDDSIVAGDGGELANVVVSLKSDTEELKGDAPKEPAILDQKGCQYTPRVVALVVGQPLLVKNSDDFLHNVHTLPFDNEPGQNFGQPRKDEKGKDIGGSIKVPERFLVKCDVHPWMSAHINAFAHPFFAVTKEDGTFSIPTKGLKDGTYTLEIWHEKLAAEPVTQEVTVKDGKATVEDVKLAADAANAAADAVEGDVKLVSAEEKACETTGGKCCEAKSKAETVAAAAAKAE